jgi:hypothetical protein
MKQFPYAVALILTLGGCDGGFRYHGNLRSSTGAPLVECTEQLEYGDGKLARGPVPVNPPNLDGGWTVAPHDGEYTLVLACKGHEPYRRRFRYGSEVLPSKDLELGEVVLEFLGSAPNNSFKPTPLRGAA